MGRLSQIAADSEPVARLAEARVWPPRAAGRQVSTFVTLASIDGGPQSMVKRPLPERAATAALRRKRPFAGTAIDRLKSTQRQSFGSQPV
jgi:hypothetical protein